jgi:hypothetical protein
MGFFKVLEQLVQVCEAEPATGKVGTLLVVSEASGENGVERTKSRSKAGISRLACGPHGEEERDGGETDVDLCSADDKGNDDENLLLGCQRRSRPCKRSINSLEITVSVDVHR